MNHDLDGLTYRQAAASDSEVLADLRIEFLTELDPELADGNTDQLRASLRTYFAETLAGGTFVAWLAEIDDDVVATGGMVLWRIPARDVHAAAGKLGYILNCYTVPALRKRGILSRLMQKLIDAGRARGVAELQLHATGDGIGIYRRLGFAEPRYPVLEMKP